MLFDPTYKKCPGEKEKVNEWLPEAGGGKGHSQVMARGVGFLLGVICPKINCEDDCTIS